jgi:hypothetical protein
MSSWDDLRQSFHRWGDKINAAVDDIADQTAVQFKLSARRGDLEKEYANLGRLTYDKLNPTTTPDAATDADAPDTLTEQINAAMSRITAILGEIEALEARVK